MKNTFRTMAALFILLAVLLAGCALAEEVPTPSPTPTPLPTVAPEDLNALQFVITGPDGNEVATITYEEFTEGKYRLENLVPGTYTVSEVDPDRLLEEKGYKFDEENSVTTLTFEVRSRLSTQIPGTSKDRKTRSSRRLSRSISEFLTASAAATVLMHSFWRLRL